MIMDSIKFKIDCKNGKIDNNCYSQHNGFKVLIFLKTDACL